MKLLKFKLPIVIAFCFMTLPLWAQEIIKLSKDEVALIAYGSLMNKESLEKSLGYTYDGPFKDVELNGWKRTWNVSMPNKAFFTETPGGLVTPEKIVYLNITQDHKTNMNAVLFVIKKSELESFNRREWIYDPTDLSKFLKGAEVQGGKVLGYVGKPEHLLKAGEKFPQVAVRQTYIDTVKKAILAKGESHLLAYERTTEEVPKFVMQDKVDPNIDVFGYKKVAEKTKAKLPDYSQCLRQLLIPLSR